MTHTNPTPGLFGLQNSNRDFSEADSWGKNKFNSSFPASLCCYMAKKGLAANYLQFSDGIFSVKEIAMKELFGTDPLEPDTFFSFETSFNKFDQYAVGNNPRTDLVVSITGPNPRQTAALEVKLTAIPDQTTHHLEEREYGAELVVRPDTIFYLAAGLAHDNMAFLKKHFSDKPIHLADWTDPTEALERFGDIHSALSDFLNDPNLIQHPNIIQPVWKTLGKSPQLAENCLDVFAWSTAGFLHFLLSISQTESGARISRTMRTVIWTYSMLLDIALDGKTNFHATIDSLSYNTKNDKAFSAAGTLTKNFMRHANLTRPRIKKSDVCAIILNGGQNMLSPERRFDAIIVNSPELFEK
jgi:type II restriction enzyme